MELSQKISQLAAFFQELSKATPEEFHSALSKLDEAIQKGHVDPAIKDTIRQFVYGDDHSGGAIGNLKAYNSFMSHKRDGVHVRMDLNDFKHINDTYGHEVGDQVLGHVGRAIRESVDESVGKERAKAFHMDKEYNAARSGGDEFHVHVPDYNAASLFVRKMRDKLENLPRNYGKVTMSAGFGETPEMADSALYKAKEAKKVHRKQMGFPPGHELNQSFAHSHIPGFEGAIPLQSEQLPLTRPQEAPATLPVSTNPAPPQPVPPSQARPVV